MEKEKKILTGILNNPNFKKVISTPPEKWEKGVKAFKELETQKTFINKHKKKVIFHLRRNGKRSGKQLRREFRELLHKQTCLEDEIASILEQKAKECVLFLLE